MISLIAAMTRARVIGADNRLPWRLPEDLRRFRRLTTGHAVVMGRKTFESIGRPLPERRNIVITRQPEFRAAGIEIAASLEAASELAGEGEVFVIGGAEIYRLALPRADRLYLTWIEREFAGDAYFPLFDPAEFREIESEEHLDEEIPHRFVMLQRA